jgi:acyl-CoA dehydrogenase
VVVPLDAPGFRIERMLPVFGEYDEPYGHGEATFTNVRVPASNLIGGPGMGFAIAQGRLGPGRIHHCMRCIGAAERALELLIDRATGREAFGKPLVNLGGNRERIAHHRLAIDQARLLVLHAAWRLDRSGPVGAFADVSAIKVVAPSVLEAVVDDAIQVHGGLGPVRRRPAHRAVRDGSGAAAGRRPGRGTPGDRGEGGAAEAPVRRRAASWRAEPAPQAFGGCPPVVR